MKRGTYRIDADVVPAFEHRRYVHYDNAGKHKHLTGTQFLTDKSDAVINWNQQTYENGIQKNDVTSRRFKRSVRILKNLRNYMQEEKVIEAKDIASFLIECILWNVPNERFTNKDNYTDMMKLIFIYLIEATASESFCNEWGEVNELKYLFRTGQPWTREQANKFLITACNYLGFKI